jgi:hypothetical protein
MALNKQKEKIMKELKSIDPNRVVFSPVDNLIQAFQKFFGDDVPTYKLTFDMVRVAYCKKKKVADMPGMEIDIQTFFTVMHDIYMTIAEKKLLRSVILLSYVFLHPLICFIVW